MGGKTAAGRTRRTRAGLPCAPAAPRPADPSAHAPSRSTERRAPSLVLLTPPRRDRLGQSPAVPPPPRPSRNSHVVTSAACPWRLLTGRQAFPSRAAHWSGAPQRMRGSAGGGSTGGRLRPLSPQPSPAAGRLHPPPPSSLSGRVKRRPPTWSAAASSRWASGGLPRARPAAAVRRPRSLPLGGGAAVQREAAPPLRGAHLLARAAAALSLPPPPLADSPPGAAAASRNRRHGGD